MSRHHDPPAPAPAPEVRLRAVVHDLDPVAGDSDGQPAGQSSSKGASIIVAAHGEDGSDEGERAEDLLCADVAGVKDQVGSPQGGDGLGPEEPMRVGDQSDERSKNSFTAAMTVSISSSVSVGKIGRERLVFATASETGSEGGGPNFAIAGWRWLAMG